MMTLEEARVYFERDRFATYAAGIRIDEVTETGAVCSFEIEDRHLAVHNGVMGGAIYTLADFAFAVAANCGGVPTVTTSSTIHYLGQPKGKRLIAECRVIKNGKRTCLYETLVTDENGVLVAQITSGGMHVG